MVVVVQGSGLFGQLADSPAGLLVRSLADRGEPDVITEVLEVSRAHSGGPLCLT
jgi:hypothetical protein